MKTVYLSMKATKAAFLCTLLLLCSLATFAQTTVRGFNYQAIARDASGNPVVNKNITIQLSIRKDNDEGLIVWQESYTTSTNDYGLFTLVIGQGTSTGAGTLSSMSMVNWSTGYYYVQVWADFGQGLTDMGTTELQSVPYAMMADSAMAGPKYPLSTLPDVNATGLSPNMILMWNGTQWVPVNPTTTIEAGVTAKIQNDSAYLTGLINTETTNRMNADNNIATTITNDSAVLTTMINNNRSTLTTFEGLPSGQMYVGNSNNMAAPVTMTGDATLTNVGMMTISNNAVTTSKILDGSVTNSKIIAGVDAAKIADGSVSNTDFENISSTKGNLQSQITVNANNIAVNTTSINAITNLPGGEMYVGNAGNTATQVSMSGDATMSNTGAVTIANGAITDAKVAPGINADKIGNGTVTNTQFQYLQGASSNIQSQINTFGNIALANEDSIRSLETQVGANTANISTDASNISSLQNQVTTNTTNITTDESNISTLQTGVQSLNTTTTSLQNQVTTNTTNITTDESNITTLQGQVTTNTGNINDLQDGVESLFGRTASLQNQINVNDTAIAGNTTNITSLQSQVNTNATNIATDESNIGSMQTSIGNMGTQLLSNGIAIQQNTEQLQTLTTQVDSNTADIITNTSNITSLQNLVNTDVASATASIYYLETTVLTLQTNASSLGTLETTDAANIGALQSAQNDDATSINNLDASMTTAQATLNTIGVAETTDASNITALQTAETTDATNISNIQSSLSTLSADVLTYATSFTNSINNLDSSVNTLNSLQSGQIFVGNASNVTTPVTMSGAINMDNTGNTTINNGVVTVPMLAATGTTDSTTYLRGDGTWASISGGSTGTVDSSNITTGGISGTNIANGTVTVNNIAAGGGASSTTFLCGNGTWANPLTTTLPLGGGQQFSAMQSVGVLGGTNTNIYQDNSNSAIVIVTCWGLEANIIYNSANAQVGIEFGQTIVFLKTSLTGFTEIYSYGE